LRESTKKLEHLEKARWLASWCADKPERRRTALERVTAARTAVSAYIRVREHGEEVDGGPAVSRKVVERLGVLAAAPESRQLAGGARLLAVDTLADGRSAVIMTVDHHSREHIDPTHRVVSTVRPKVVTVLVNPKDGGLEVRGASADHEIATRSALSLLRRAGVDLRLDQLKLTEPQFQRLKKRLDVRVRRERCRPSDAKVSGIGTAHYSAAQEVDDLTNAPGYKKLGNREITEWQCTFTYDDKPYALHFNWLKGTLYFPHGEVSGDVIRHVMEAVHTVRGA
jgi:hypothetical protein